MRRLTSVSWSWVHSNSKRRMSVSGWIHMIVPRNVGYYMSILLVLIFLKCYKKHMGRLAAYRGYLTVQHIYISLLLTQYDHKVFCICCLHIISMRETDNRKIWITCYLSFVFIFGNYFICILQKGDFPQSQWFCVPGSICPEQSHPHCWILGESEKKCWRSMLYFDGSW